VLKFYRSTCPQTKHIILIRHPVLWFESFYNYRKLGGDTWAFKDPNPNNLVGPVCSGKSGYVCDYNGAFHFWMARMGKTPMAKDSGELDLLAEYLVPLHDQIQGHRVQDDSIVFPNPVFLIETSQLSDPDPQRRQQLQKDVQQYLGLQTPLGEIPHSNSGAALKERKKKREDLIDICETQYAGIHDRMMEISRNASMWFRDYFLQSPEVVTSSRNHLESLLEKWMEDPCLERRKVG
ncbi:MAG: hypothetical protein SGARI_006235, partial [Bacillariaceae sp.]